MRKAIKRKRSNNHKSGQHILLKIAARTYYFFRVFTEIKAKDGKLYVSAIFDYFDSSILGLTMETNMKVTLCEHTLDNAYLAYPELRGAILHSDRGTQYTSKSIERLLQNMASFKV